MTGAAVGKVEAVERRFNGKKVQPVGSSPTASASHNGFSIVPSEIKINPNFQEGKAVSMYFPANGFPKAMRSIR